MEKSVLIVTVGGSPDQIVKTIGSNKCEYVLFVCSEGTCNVVDDVLEFVSIKKHKIIELEDHENLNRCYLNIVQEVPKYLKKWNKTYEDTIVDYTGGTKVMSAAIILATSEKCNQYCYIGGANRGKEGIGMVISGSERVLYHSNPWDVLAVGKLKIIDSLFEKARYLSVVEEFSKFKEVVDSRLKGFYEAMSDITSGYYLWDNFKHKDSLVKLKEGYKELKKYSIICDTNLDLFLSEIHTNLECLSKLCESYNGENLKNDADSYRNFLVDLISNAVRRGEKENKYDDAVARLYSSIEKLGRKRLFDWGIDNSKVNREDIPSNLLEEFESEKVNGRSYYKLGYQKSFILLSAYDEKFRIKYNDDKAALEEVMRTRNQSILAHGIKPVSKGTYNNMLFITLNFLDIDFNELTDFPRMNLGEWGDKILRY